MRRRSSSVMEDGADVIAAGSPSCIE
jgi:hypothetical protein